MRYDELAVTVHPDPHALGAFVADLVAQSLREAVDIRGEANLVLASGNSQLAFVEALIGVPLPWDRIRLFHMDEYVGIDPAHPASFVRWMQDRVVSAVRPKVFHPVRDVGYEQLLRGHPVDVCVLGIGENGHLAFNDPPADLDDPAWVKVVELDEACKRQQVGEGHFATIADVPPTAITMTVPALLAAAQVFAVVPDARKADAVHRALTGPISGECPASALRRCGHAQLHLDEASASLLT